VACKATADKSAVTSLKAAAKLIFVESARYGIGVPT
jgi:hypothetical protein